MARWRSPLQLELTGEERVTLERLARAQVQPHRVVLRAKMILMVADGWTISAVARSLSTPRKVVRKWAQRFVHKRLAGLADAYRSGRPARFPPGDGRPSGEDGLRAAGCLRPVAVAVDVR